jgi:hypothetical protein
MTRMFATLSAGGVSTVGEPATAAVKAFSWWAYVVPLRKCSTRSKPGPRTRSRW